MLEQMRSAAGSWVARILMLFLMVSFGLWGIGDYIRPKVDNTAATVGDRSISDQQFQSQFRLEARMLQIQTGINITPELAKQYGIYDNVIGKMVNQVLFELAASKLGLNIREATAAELIRVEKGFQNALGQFDINRFRAIVANMGMSEQGYLEQFRSDIIRSELSSGLTDGIFSTPTVMVEAIYGYREQRRTAEFVTIAAEALPRIPDPTAAELEEFYKANGALFVAPELRTITFAALTPKDFAKSITVSDDQVAEEYAAQKAAFTVPERRQVEQGVFPTEAAARAALDKIKGGADFGKTLEEALNVKPADLSLGVITQNDLPPQLGAPVFALALNTPSEPIQTPFGWHVVRVSEIMPGSIKPLAEVAPMLREQIAEAKAADQLVKLGQQAEDKLAGGASLEETAKSLGFTLTTVADIDQRGMNVDGQPVAGVPTTPDFLETAFKLPERGDLQVTELRDRGLYITQVDKVTPAQIRPLDQVKAQVSQAWSDAQRAKAAEAMAQAAVERLKSDPDLTKIATDFKSTVQTSPALLRTGNVAAGGSGQNPFATLTLSNLFSLPDKGVTAGLAADSKTWLVARVTSIVDPDIAANEAAAAALRKEFAEAATVDLLSQYRQLLEKRYPVDIHRKVIESGF